MSVSFELLGGRGEAQAPSLGPLLQQQDAVPQRRHLLHSLVEVLEVGAHPRVLEDKGGGTRSRLVRACALVCLRGTCGHMWTYVDTRGHIHMWTCERVDTCGQEYMWTCGHAHVWTGVHVDLCTWGHVWARGHVDTRIGHVDIRGRLSVGFYFSPCTSYTSPRRHGPRLTKKWD